MKITKRALTMSAAVISVFGLISLTSAPLALAHSYDGNHDYQNNDNHHAWHGSWQDRHGNDGQETSANQDNPSDQTSDQTSYDNRSADQTNNADNTDVTEPTSDQLNQTDETATETTTTPVTTPSSTSTDQTTTTTTPSATEFPQGMVSLNFDDGWQDAFTNALPILDAAGLKSTQFIITGSLGTPGYITNDQLAQYAADGQEIGAHTRTHADLTTLNATQLADEINGSRQDLSNLGINASIFDYPEGVYSSTVRQAVIDAGFTGARSVDGGFNTPSSDKFLLTTQNVDNTTTPQQIISWIDQAVANHQWLILVMHHVSNDTSQQYNNTPETLQTVVDYLKNNNIPVVTLSQGLSRMNP